MFLLTFFHEFSKNAWMLAGEPLGPWWPILEDLEVIIDPKNEFCVHNFIIRDEIIYVCGCAYACAWILCYQHV